MDKTSKRILIAPLDWGLGHVSRCVPIIQYIVSTGHQVILAGNESQQKYLQTIFPQLAYLQLNGYNVQYATTKLAFMPKLLMQIPKIRSAIRREYLWLQEQIKIHRIDAVISDNRYGLYSTLAPCVLLTHQLHILSGMGLTVDALVQRWHYQFIQKFDQCWVVDIQENNGLSGMLAHPQYLPKLPTKYIGLLSQCADQPKTMVKQEHYLLVLLSGAEPQRSILFDMLWQQALVYDGKIIFVAGSQSAHIPTYIPAHIQYVPLASAMELSELINGANYVICRSGYSSIMDLTALDKKAILIPTPGQTEQEYLAKYLFRKGMFFSADQAQFELKKTMKQVAAFPFQKNKIDQPFLRFKSVVDDLIAALS